MPKRYFHIGINIASSFRKNSFRWSVQHCREEILKISYILWHLSNTRYYSGVIYQKFSTLKIEFTIPSNPPQTPPIIFSGVHLPNTPIKRSYDSLDIYLILAPIQEQATKFFHIKNQIYNPLESSPDSSHSVLTSFHNIPTSSSSKLSHKTIIQLARHLSNTRSYPEASYKIFPR